MRLDRFHFQHMRVGYTQHFRVAPWTDFVEVHWGRDCQIVMTPIGPEEICLALTSSKQCTYGSQKPYCNFLKSQSA